MYGTPSAMISSLASTTLTKPTGTPMTILGCSRPARTRSQMENSAVGALPMANTASGSVSAAFSMDTSERVTPLAFACSATSASPMKQCTSPPNRASVFLLMPAMAMVVSVTTGQPLRSASVSAPIAWSEKARLSA